MYGALSTLSRLGMGGLRKDDVLKDDLRIFQEKFVFGPHMSTLQTSSSHRRPLEILKPNLTSFAVQASLAIFEIIKFCLAQAYCLAHC